jgi:sugar/nucleoside kinase (ribokinase family)
VRANQPILIVGSMAFDDLELPTGRCADVVGGSATYSAFAASCFAPARVVAVVGEDFPPSAVERLEKRKIDVTGIEHVKGKTFRWAGRYSKDLNSRETLDTQLNVFADFRPKLPESYRESPFVLLGNIHPALQLQVLEQVSRPKLVVADTMNFWISGEPKTLASLLERVDVLIINDEEVRELTGIHNIKKAAREVLRRGPSRLVIKRGEHGALLFDEDGIFFAPGFPLEEVIDPTGAGDSFAGGFLGYLATQSNLGGIPMRRAMVHATATASFCVEAVGTERISTLVDADIEARISAIRELYEFGAADM